MNKPLFNVKLQIWDNWKTYWASLPWIVRKMNPQFNDIGKTRLVSGAYNPATNTIHLFLDELAQGVIAHLEIRKAFSSANYVLRFFQELSSTLIHELIHSLDIFKGDKENEQHQLDMCKLDHILRKSLWYRELVNYGEKVGNVLYTTDNSSERTKDSSKEPGSEEAPEE